VLWFPVNWVYVVVQTLRVDHLFCVSLSRLPNAFDIHLNSSDRQLGVAAAQSFCYYRAFPRDKPLFKYLVSTWRYHLYPLTEDFKVVTVLFVLYHTYHLHCLTIIQDSQYHRDAINQFHVLVVLFQLFSKYIPEVSSMVSCLTYITMASPGFNAVAGARRWARCLYSQIEHTQPELDLRQAMILLFVNVRFKYVLCIIYLMFFPVYFTIHRAKVTTLIAIASDADLLAPQFLLSPCMDKYVIMRYLYVHL